MARHYTTTARWADCPSRGAGQAITGQQVSRGMLGLMGFSSAAVERAFAWREPSYRPYVMHCGGCGQPIGLELGRIIVGPVGTHHTIRTIDVPQREAESRGKCNGVCLNGKRSCDCHCRGKCHGAGACTCTLAPR